MRLRTIVFYQTERVELGVWTRYSLLILAEPRPEVLPPDRLPSGLEYLPEKIR